MMSKVKSVCQTMIIIILLGLVAVPAIATDYYVDQNHAAANDTNAGTSESAPWETLRKATQTVVAGDTVYVKAGTYIDTIESDPYDKFKVVNDGTAADPITFISSPRHAAIVRSASLPSSRNDYAWGIGDGAEYIIIDGFKIEGGLLIGDIDNQTNHMTVRNCEVLYGRCPDSDSSLNWGLTVYGADYCTIENNYVHDMIFSGSTSHNAACIMVFVDSDYNIIQGNTADAGGSVVYSAFGQKGGQMDNNIWRYNLALNATAGFLGMGSTSEVYPSEDNTFYQNIIVNCERTFFLDHMAYRFVIYNNTAVDCNWFLGASMITNINTEQWNNILVGTNDVAIRWSGYPTAEPFTTLLDYSNYNCFYNCSQIAEREKIPRLNYYTLGEWQTAWGFDMDSIVDDPSLVGDGDYHLDTGSPCIDAGIDLQDYDGDLNTTEAINMGAYITGSEVIGCDWEPVVLPPTAASNPSPGNGDINVSILVDLIWAAGSGATSHDVYFGTNLNDVNNGSHPAGDVDGSGLVDWDDMQILAQQWLTDPAGANPSADLNGNNDVNFVDLAIVAADWRQADDAVFKGNQTETTFTPAAMAESTTYYWRIDAVNAAGTTTGTVWSFTTATPGGPIKINFQHSTVITPTGYEADEAHLYGDRGNGLSYGWDNWDGSGATTRFGTHPDVRYDSLVHFAPVDLAIGRAWEIGLDNGTYDLWVVCSDPEYGDFVSTLDIEGTVVIDSDGKDKLDEFLLQVDVLDGRLTIAPHNITADSAYADTHTDRAYNSKIAFIEITAAP